MAPAFVGFLGQTTDWPLTDKARSALAVHTDALNGSQNCVSLSAPFLGRWEDDVLVVETTGFLEHASGIREGVPSSSAKRLIERFELNADRTLLAYSYELSDPEYLSAPVTGSMQWVHRPDLTYTGYECNRDVAGRFLQAE